MSEVQKKAFEAWWKIYDSHGTIDPFCCVETARDTWAAAIAYAEQQAKDAKRCRCSRCLGLPPLETEAER